MCPELHRISAFDYVFSDQWCINLRYIEHCWRKVWLTHQLVGFLVAYYIPIPFCQFIHLVV